MPKRERFKLSLSVFLFVVRGNEILLLKRGNTGWMDGFYSVPAGALDGKETLIEAIIREANEEVAITIDASNLRHIHTMHNLTENEEWIGIFFVTDQWNGTPKVNEPEKHTEVKWVTVSELPDNTIPYVRQAIEAYQKKETYSEYGWDRTHPPCIS